MILSRHASPNNKMLISMGEGGGGRVKNYEKDDYIQGKNRPRKKFRLYIYKIIVRLRHLLILNSVLGLGNTKSVSTNGEVERFVRTVKKVIKTANVERKSWKQEMYRFLRNFQTTLHTTTRVPPATALFGRAIKTKLSEFNEDEELCRREDICSTIHNEKR